MEWEQVDWRGSVSEVGKSRRLSGFHPIPQSADLPVQDRCLLRDAVSFRQTASDQPFIIDAESVGSGFVPETL